jgi:type III secretion system (T3SS) SseB-like protein
MADQPVKNENSALIQAMNAVRETGSPENWNKFYQLLIDSSLCIPVLSVPELAKSDSGGKAFNLSVIRFKDDQGHAVTPAFTDEEVMRHWRPALRAVRIPGRDFFRMVRQTDVQGVLLNFHDPQQAPLRPGGRITRFEIENLAQGVVPPKPDQTGRVDMAIDPNAEIRVGPSEAPPPEEILNALRVVGTAMMDVKELYLVELTFEKEQPHNAIGIELYDQIPNERWQAITRTLAESVNKLLTPGSFLEFVPVQGALGGAIQRQGKALLH